MTIPTMGETESRSRVRQAVQAVWPKAARVDFTRSVRPAGDGAQDFLVLPGLRSPRWLVPADARFAAAGMAATESVRTRRAAVRALAAVHRAGLTRRLPLARVRVSSHEQQSLLTELSDVLGTELTVAVRMGGWQDLRGLVMRVFGPDGTFVGFVKLALDPRGHDSVRAEVLGLSTAAGLDLEHIVCPRVLHHGPWNEHELLVTSPLVAAPERGGERGMPVDAMHELAHAGRPRVADLRSSEWWGTVRGRLGEVEDQVALGRLELAARRLDVGAGDLPMPLGLWHGDWTPWNMAWDGRTVLLWDWEHLADDVPMGFDHVHYLAQRLRVSEGAGPKAEQRWLAEAARVLADRVGLEPAQREALVVAYLVEVNLRYVLDRQSTSDHGAERSGWGLDLMESRAADLPAAAHRQRRGQA